MSDDLKDRLRATEGLRDGYGGGGARYRNPDGAEAVARIEALEAERDALVAAAFQAAAKKARKVARSYGVLKPDGKTYEAPRVQRAAMGMVRLAAEDIETLTIEDARAALRELDREPHSVLYRPSPVQGFSRPEIEAAQELLPVAEDLDAARAVHEWLAMIAHKEPRE